MLWQRARAGTHTPEAPHRHHRAVQTKRGAPKDAFLTHTRARVSNPCWVPSCARAQSSAATRAVLSRSSAVGFRSDCSACCPAPGSSVGSDSRPFADLLSAQETVQLTGLKRPPEAYKMKSPRKVRDRKSVV